MLHLGSMELKDYTGKLCDAARTRRETDRPNTKNSAPKPSPNARPRRKQFVERVYETLRKLLPEAEKRGLKLGCENRQALEEIPLESDFESFLPRI